jgi:hypothetical protein
LSPAAFPREVVRVAHPSLLVLISGVWMLTCVVLGVASVRHAPAVSFALFGSVLGAFVGFLIGNGDGPAEVPAYTAVGASIGLASCGVIGLFTTSARPPSRPLHRAGVLVVVAAPLAAVVLTFLLRGACPLYVRGADAGFCTYQDVDVLGGWLSGVIVVFLFDAVFVAGLLLISARLARRTEAFEP